MKLECIHIKGKSSKAVVLFHGYGADMNDLAPLHRYLDPTGEWHWYFPNGPLRIPFGIQWEGRAWFNIDMAALEEAMQRGTHRDFSGPATAEFKDAVATMRAFVEEIKAQHEQVVIGGFSQGAMGASHVASQIGDKLAGLVLLSGTLVDRELLASGDKSNLPFFQSHGDSDPLLGYRQAQALNQALTEKGMQGIWMPFRGGHEIPEPVLRGLKDFLQKI